LDEYRESANGFIVGQLERKLVNQKSDTVARGLGASGLNVVGANHILRHASPSDEREAVRRDAHPDDLQTPVQTEIEA
jgi:hypothetical protein